MNLNTTNSQGKRDKDLNSEPFEGDSVTSNQSQGSQEQNPRKSKRKLIILATGLLLFLLAVLFLGGGGAGLPCH